MKRLIVVLLCSAASAGTGALAVRSATPVAAPSILGPIIKTQRQGDNTYYAEGTCEGGLEQWRVTSFVFVAGKPSACDAYIALEQRCASRR